MTQTATQTGQEIWESTVDGKVSLNVPGPRGTLKNINAKGKGARLRISPGDRVVVEEGIRDRQNNPFINGKLMQVGGPVRVPLEEDEFEQDQQLSDDDLALFFTYSPEDFEAALPSLSEPNIRRLCTLFMTKGGTVAQQQIIGDYIEQTWPITSGDTPSYREMRQDPGAG